jgi:hypothetical protein
MLNYGYFVYVVHYRMLLINIYLNFPPLFQYHYIIFDAKTFTKMGNI